MVPDPRRWLGAPRRWLAGPRRVLLGSRWLALSLGVFAGVGAGVAALVYAHPSLYELLLFPLGVGGTTYYVAHYEVVLFEQSSAARIALRNLFIFYLALSLTAESSLFADSMLSFLAAFFAVSCVAATVAVDVSKDDGDDEGGEIDASSSDGGNDDSAREKPPVNPARTPVDAD